MAGEAAFTLLKEATERLGSYVAEAAAAAGGPVSVGLVRDLADKTASEVVAEAKKRPMNGIMVILSENDHFFDRVPPKSEHSRSLRDQMFDIIEEDLIGMLDVRVAWASQFEKDFCPQSHFERVNKEALDAFESALSEMGASDIGNHVRSVLGVLMGSKEKVLAAPRQTAEKNPHLLGGLLLILCQDQMAERWQAAREAVSRLGRGPDGQWELAR